MLCCSVLSHLIHHRVPMQSVLATEAIRLHELNMSLRRLSSRKRTYCSGLAVRQVIMTLIERLRSRQQWLGKEFAAYARKRSAPAASKRRQLSKYPQPFQDEELASNWNSPVTAKFSWPILYCIFHETYRVKDLVRSKTRLLLQCP